MMRSYQDLKSIEGVNYLFPWGREVFANYLHPSSPWLVNSGAKASELFGKITGKDLTAHCLSNFSRYLEAAYESSQGLAAYDWDQLSLRQHINGVDIAYVVGGNCEFLSLIEPALDADLVIVHEPFQLSYSGPRFPDQGLEHVAPSPAIFDEAVRHYAAINPKGLRTCGLHIRRGDYAIWQGGKYFYGDQFWQNIFDVLNQEAFHVSIFTNEPDAELCHNLINAGAHLSGASPGQDLVRMMLMDRVIGPPSTFPLVARSLAKCCLQRSVLYDTLPSKTELSGMMQQG